jgi:hypothetical protein
MNKHHPYNNIIERKLEQLPPVNADHLWNDMHGILDKKMPQKKERRRFIVWWFLTGKGLLLLTVGVLTITGSSLFFLSRKESSTVTIKLPDSPQSNEFVVGGTAKVFPVGKENITTTSELNQKISDKIAITVPSASAIGHLSSNIFIPLQTIKASKKNTAKDQFNQPIQTITEARAKFDIVTVNLRLIPKDSLFTTNHIEEKNSLSLQQKPTINKLKLNSRNNNNESGFYTGIMSGVDLSSIHFRSVKTGATKGFIIGYAFNKKWSIESGLLWDKKRIYDNGSYFNPPGYTATNGITIVAVNGKSHLYEWPVNMKYTIISGKHNLFATTGISSYLMRSENYDYEYVQNNQPGGHNYLNYKNETKNWFSVVNFSIGYSHKLGVIGSIRVEPYLKLPIKNIGVGNMPIMSTGLNIGFTRTLRR